MKRLSILAVLLAAMLIVGGTIIASIGSAFSLASHGSQNVAWAAPPGTLVDRDFDLGNATRVVVNARNLDLRIAPSATAGNGLHLSGRVPAQLVSRIAFARSGSTATLTLAPDPYVNTSSWSFSFSDDVKPLVVTLESSRRIDVLATSGDIELGNWRAPFGIETTSGDVRLAGTQTPGTIRTTSGDVHAIDLAGGLDARTSSGDVEGTFASLARNVSIVTTSGDVELHVPASVRAALVTHTSSGDLENGASLPPSLAGAPTIEVTTSSGDIVTRR